MSNETLMLENKSAYLARTNPIGYTSDQNLSMWELGLGSEYYHFICEAEHPLTALRFIFDRPEMEQELDSIESDIDPQEWSIRQMLADEIFHCSSEEDSIGPLQMIEGEWRGTVKEAVDMFEEEMIVCSTAWAF